MGRHRLAGEQGVLRRAALTPDSGIAPHQVGKTRLLRSLGSEVGHDCDRRPFIIGRRKAALAGASLTGKALPQRRGFSRFREYPLVPSCWLKQPAFRDNVLNYNKNLSRWLKSVA